MYDKGILETDRQLGSRHAIFRQGHFKWYHGTETRL